MTAGLPGGAYPKELKTSGCADHVAGSIGDTLRRPRMSRFVLVYSTLVVLLAGCSASTRERYVTVGTRRLFVSCSGDESNPATVILIAGGSYSSEVWNDVQARVATSARVCSFDKAGVGKSDPSPHPQTAQEIAADIYALLREAGEDPPYILVGHSVGGIYARIFAALFPESVGGFVLIDSAHEEQIWRLAAIAPALLDAEYGNAWRDSATRRNLGFLGDGETLRWRTEDPLIVLQQGRPLSARPDLGLTADAVPRVTALWKRLQEDLASRSPSGEVRTAQRSGHFIQTDEPELVVQAVRDVLRRLAASSRR